MDDDSVSDRHINRRAAGPVACGAAISGQGVDVNVFVGDGSRNSLVERVDRAAYGLTAEQQDGGAAQHFNPLDRQGVDSNRMVRRCVGRVDIADTVR